MSLQPYRRVLAVPGVRTSVLLMFVARLPMTAMSVSMTLHVVLGLGRGYGAAGLVATMITAGSALAAPLLGRLIDRRGLPLVASVCGAGSAVYWLGAPYLPFPALLAAALPAGALAVPASAVAKQVLAALVPLEQRRTAFSLDSVSVEIAFMVGPAAGILLATQLSTAAALSAIGVAYAVAAAILALRDPPIRTAQEQREAGPRPPLRAWLTPGLRQALVLAVGALFVLAGAELAVLAALRESGEVEWTSLVIVVMCAASVAGGLVHGGAARSLPQLTLLLLLACLVLPLGVATDPWWLLMLAVIPANLVCAPTLAATTETVSGLAPAAVRGEALGLQDAAVRLGLALGFPVIGFVIDQTSAAWGFAAAGLGGLLLAGIAALLGRPVRRSPAGRSGGTEHPAGGGGPDPRPRATATSPVRTTP